jgi:hypothetical protein
VSIQLDYVGQGRVIETFEGVFVSPTDATASFTGLDTAITLDATTDVPVSKHSEGEMALTAGALSINLAALPGKTSEETVNGTGLKVQYWKFRNKATNANAMTLTKGASNGYGQGPSGGSWTIVLAPGQESIRYGNEADPDIASGARTIDVAGTGAQVLEYELVMG